MTEIRRVQGEELRALVTLYKENFKDHNIFKHYEQHIMKYVQQKYTELRDNDGAIFIAVLNNEIIGGCMIEQKEITSDNHSRFDIRHLIVDKKFRNIGCGKNLVEESLKLVFDRINRKEISSAKIEVSVIEGDAVPFYEKIGFKREGLLQDHYKLGESTIILGLTLKGGEHGKTS